MWSRRERMHWADHISISDGANTSKGQSPNQWEINPLGSQVSTSRKNQEISSGGVKRMSLNSRALNGRFSGDWGPRIHPRSREVTHLSIAASIPSESFSVMSNFLWLYGLYSPWNSPGQNTGVGSPSLLQGIFPNPGIEPRSRTQVSCNTGRFFTSWTTRKALETKENLQHIGVAYSNTSSTKRVCPSPSADVVGVIHSSLSTPVRENAGKPSLPLPPESSSRGRGRRSQPIIWPDILVWDIEIE